MIGPGYHQDDEEVKAAKPTPFLTQVSENLNQSHHPRTAKLDPIKSDHQPNSDLGGGVINESQEQMLSEKDINELFQRK